MNRRGHSHKRIILGVTGSLGCGKTTVAKMLHSFGARVIDADAIAHRIIKPKTRVYRRILRIFGRDILNKDKAIDRAKLARLVFGDLRLLKELNKIMHPEIIRIIRDQIKTAGHSRVIVLDAPLLIEAGLKEMVDKLIVVTATRDRQLERIMQKTFLSKKEILRRIRLQAPLREKVRIADFIIDNNGTKARTRKQVAQIRRLLWKS